MPNVKDTILDNIVDNYEIFVNPAEEEDTKRIKVLGYKSKYLEERRDLTLDILSRLILNNVVSTSIPWIVIANDSIEVATWNTEIENIEKYNPELIDMFKCINILSMHHIYDYPFTECNIVWDLDDDLSIEDFSNLYDYITINETLVLYNEDTTGSLKRLRYHLSQYDFIFLNARNEEDTVWYYNDLGSDITIVDINFGMQKMSNTLLFDYYKFDNNNNPMNITYNAVNRSRLLYKSKSYLTSMSVLSSPREYFTLFNDKINTIRTNFKKNKVPSQAIVDEVDKKISKYRLEQKMFILDNKTNQSTQIISAVCNPYKTIMINPLPRLRNHSHYMTYLSFQTWLSKTIGGIIVNTFDSLSEKAVKRAEMIVIAMLTPSISRDIEKIRKISPDTKIVLLCNREIKLERKIIKSLKSKNNNFKSYDIKNFINLLSE